MAINLFFYALVTFYRKQNALLPPTTHPLILVRPLMALAWLTMTTPPRPSLSPSLNSIFLFLSLKLKVGLTTCPPFREEGRARQKMSFCFAWKQEP